MSAKKTLGGGTSDAVICEAQHDHHHLLAFYNLDDSAKAPLCLCIPQTRDRAAREALDMAVATIPPGSSESMAKRG